jgi:uncharacterized protein (DUF305 family)
VNPGPARSSDRVGPATPSGETTLAVRRYLAVALVLLATVAAVVAVTRGPHRHRPPVAETQPAAETSVAAPTPADADYAQMMIAHHTQAVQMSKDLLARAGIPDRTRDIARFIIADQQREIDQLTAWLTAWQLDTGGGDEMGMLSPTDLTQLHNAPSAEAGTLYLRGMIKHHQGAIAMSWALLNGDGKNVFIHSIAKHVINEQTAENNAMKALLPGNPT